MDSAAAYIFQMMSLSDDARDAKPPTAILNGAALQSLPASSSVQSSDLSLNASDTGAERDPQPAKDKSCDSSSLNDQNAPASSRKEAIVPPSEEQKDDSASASHQKKIDAASTHKHHEASSKHSKHDAHLSNRQRQELKKRAKKEAKAEERRAPAPPADPLPGADKLGSMAI